MVSHNTLIADGLLDNLDKCFNQNTPYFFSRKILTKPFHPEWVRS